MADLLAARPLLTLFLVLALGTAVGRIRIGPLRFGAAGALFVGLAFGAWDPRLGEGLGLVQSIGLALFVYTIGIAAGSTFFRDLTRQAPLMGAGALLTVAAAGLAIAAGKVLDLGGAIAAGMFAGATTATPALASATVAAGGSQDPAVGYAIAYPVGVIITLIFLSPVARTCLPAAKDPEPLSTAGLVDITVAVRHPMPISQIPHIAFVHGVPGSVRVSYLLRDGVVRVADPDEDMRAGDRVVLVGAPASVEEAAQALGRRVTTHLADDHSVVTFRRFVVSDPKVAGRTVAELHIPKRFGAVITRVRRGDHDLLAQYDMPLQLGDRVRVIYPRGREEDLRRLFGDSEKQVTEVDFLTFGLGIALGVAVGLITLPIGGAALALGSAAGPLLVGLVLGRLGRTGPFVWSMPLAANLTVRQFGLMLFLGAVGLASGQAFASTAFSLQGLAVGAAAAAMLQIVLPAFWWTGRALGLSAPRTAGAMAGFIGKPVLLARATALADDERVESGYSALFALGMIIKIVAAQAIVLL